MTLDERARASILMTDRTYRTGVVISGDAAGGIRAFAATGAAMDDLHAKAARGGSVAASYRNSIGGAVKSLDELEAKALLADKALEGINEVIGRSPARFAAMAIGASILVGLVEASRRMFESTIEGAQAQAQLTASIRLNGDAAGVTREELEQLAQTLSRQSTFSEAAVISTEALLLRFRGMSGDVLPRAVRASLDMAAALGISLPEAAQKIGKAMQDPINGMQALQREGIRLTQVQQDQVLHAYALGDGLKAQGIILGEVERHVGGTADAITHTLGGALSQLKNSVGDLLEQKDGMPALTTAINDFTKEIQKPEIKQAVDILGAAVTQTLADIVNVSTIGLLAIERVANAAKEARSAANSGAGIATGVSRFLQYGGPGGAFGAMQAFNGGQIPGMGTASVDADTAAHKEHATAVKLDDDVLKQLLDTLDPLNKLLQEHEVHLGQIRIALAAGQITQQRANALLAEEAKQYADRRRQLDPTIAANQKLADSVRQIEQNSNPASEAIGKFTDSLGTLYLAQQRFGSKGPSDSDIGSFISDTVTKIVGNEAPLAHAVATYRNQINELQGVFATLMTVNPALAMAHMPEIVQAMRAAGQQLSEFLAKTDEAGAKIESNLTAKFQDMQNALVDLSSEWGRSAAQIANGLERIVGAHEDVAKAQDQVNKLQKEGKEGTAAYAVAQKDLADAQSAVSSKTLGAYGAMAAGAAAFFKEGSSGYKAMQDASKVFYAFELAQEVLTTAQKLGLINAVTIAKLFGYQAQTAAAVASVGPTVAAEGAKAEAAGVAGVAAQTSAGPYIGFALAAAMIVFLASLGVRTRGGGNTGVNLAADRQKTQGTGTVLGDVTKQSESISHSLDALKDFAGRGLGYSQQMIEQLRAINEGINGFGALLYQQNASAGGATPFAGFAASKIPNALGQSISDVTIQSPSETLFRSVPLLGQLSALGPGLARSLVGALFGSTKYNLADTGIALDPSQLLGSILGGGQANAQYYADIHKHTGSLFGLSNSDSVSRETQALDPQTQSQITKIIGGLGDTILTGVQALGGDVDQARKILDALKIGDLLKQTDISLMGLTGDALNKAVAAVFSSLGDAMAQQAGAALANIHLDAFQQVGEGLLQTLVRVAGGFEAAQADAEQLHLTLAPLTDALATSADIEGDLVRATVHASETVGDLTSGLGQMVDQFSGTGAEVAAFAQKLYDLRAAINRVNKDGQALDQVMVQAAGGIDNFASALGDYNKNFFSDKERTAQEVADLNKQLQVLVGQNLPDTRDGFRHLVEGLDLTTETGRKLFGELIALAPRAAQAYDGLEAATKQALDDLNNALTGYQDEFNKVAQDYQAAVQGIGDTLKQETSAISQARAGIDQAILGIQRQQAGWSEAAYQSSQISQLRGQLGKGSVTDQIGTVQSLQAAIVARYNAEAAQLQNVQQQQQQIYQQQVQAYQQQMQQYQSQLAALQQLKAFTDGLRTSDLSPLMSGDRLAALKGTYGKALLRAQSGDPTAIQGLQGAAQAYLQEARNYYASSDQYSAIFQGVTGSLDRISGKSLKAPTAPVASISSGAAIAAQQAKLQQDAIDELKGLDKTLDDLQKQAQADYDRQFKALAQQFQDDTDRVVGEIKAATAAAALANKQAHDDALKVGQTTINAINLSASKIFAGLTALAQTQAQIAASQRTAASTTKAA